MAHAALPAIAVAAAVPNVMSLDETKAAMVVTSGAPEGPAPVMSMVSPTSDALKSAPVVVKSVLEAVVVPSVLLASEVRSHWAVPLIEVCAAHRVSHVVLAGGLPSSAAVRQIKQAGIRVFCFASALGLARKLARMGVDAIVIEGSEAGGHIGPVSTGVLAQEILPHFAGLPVFVAGGIGRGEAMLAYLEMGAAGVQLGTRFVCAHESIAHPRFKQAFIRASARDAVASVQLDHRFPVIPVRALSNPATKRFIAMQRSVIDRFVRGELTQKAAQLEIEHFWAGALRRAVIDGDIETGSLMAGQSVGLVTREQSTVEIIEELVGQALAVLAARSRRALDRPLPRFLEEAGAQG